MPSLAEKGKEFLKSSISESAGNLATGTGKNEENEPIKTVRPRYAYLGNDQGTRGQRATIELLNPAKEFLKKAFENDSIQVNNVDIPSGMSEVVKELIGEGTAGKKFQSFFLQRVDVSFQEKTDIKQLFGDAEVVYHFGRAPIVYQLSGLLFDDGDNQWFTKFCMAYLYILRGTKLAQNNEAVRINLPNCSLIGTIDALQYSQDSARDTDIPFSLRFIVKKITYKPVKVDAGLSHYAGEMTVPNFVTAPTLSQRQIQVTKEQLRNLQDGVTLSTDKYYNNTFGQAAEAIDSFALNFRAEVDDILGNIREFSELTSEVLRDILAPINSVLGVVQDVSTAATSIVRAVEEGVDQTLNVAESLVYNYEQTKILVRNSAGIIAATPETLSERISRFLRDGVLNGTTAILTPDLIDVTAGETAQTLASRTPRTVAGSGTVGNDITAVLSGAAGEENEEIASL